MTKSGKQCGKRRNCLFWAISSFVTMFSKSCLLQRRQKASIWGKGFIPLQIKWFGLTGIVALVTLSVYDEQTLLQQYTSSNENWWSWIIDFVDWARHHFLIISGSYFTEQVLDIVIFLMQFPTQTISVLWQKMDDASSNDICQSSERI